MRGVPGNSPDFRVTVRKPDLVRKIVLLVLILSAAGSGAGRLEIKKTSPEGSVICFTKTIHAASHDSPRRVVKKTTLLAALIAATDGVEQLAGKVLPDIPAIGFFP